MFINHYMLGMWIMFHVDYLAILSVDTITIALYEGNRDLRTKVACPGSHSLQMVESR
jgi:hypothetical protein